MANKYRIGFIGAGKFSTGFASCLAARNFSVVAVSSKSYDTALKFAETISGCEPIRENQQVADVCDIVFITTPDDCIQTIATEVSWRPNHYVLHCSGALNSDVLNAAKDLGALTGSFHPLQSIISAAQAENILPGSAFAIEAEGDVANFLTEIVEALGGTCLFLGKEKKALYHLSAVFGSNFLLTLAALAVELMQKAGLSENSATDGLVHLMKGTIRNIEKHGFSASLTGPIPRGDNGTVEKHLRLLEQEAPELSGLYKQLGIQLISLSQSRGELDTEKAQQLRSVLDFD